MSVNAEPSRENLTLTAADLAACQPLAGAGGQVLRARCPFHGSDHQRSWRVTPASGRFVCFACGAWGYLAEARERWLAAQPRQLAPGRSVPGPARHPAGAGPAAGRGLCGAGHLAAGGARLARGPRGGAVYDAGGAPGESVRARGRDGCPGAQSPATRSLAGRERLLQRRRAARR